MHLLATCTSLAAHRRLELNKMVLSSLRSPPRPDLAQFRFSIDHSNPRTCESADFAYGRPSGPYRASTVRF